MPKLTLDIIMEACERTMFDGEMVGFCIDCGVEHDNCEPDARKYTCEACGKNKVYGAEEILLMVGP